MCLWKDSGRSIQNKEPSGTSGPWMWFISCPPISRYKSCLFWFYCPLRRPPNTWLFQLFSTLSLGHPGFCNSFWPLWLPMLLSISFIWPCTKCRSSGVFMPFTILRRRWIGSRAHAPTLWTTHLSGDLSWFLSCLGFRNQSSWHI